MPQAVQAASSSPPRPARLPPRPTASLYQSLLSRQHHSQQPQQQELSQQAPPPPTSPPQLPPPTSPPLPAAPRPPPTDASTTLARPRQATAATETPPPPPEAPQGEGSIVGSNGSGGSSTGVAPSTPPAHEERREEARAYLALVKASLDKAAFVRFTQLVTQCKSGTSPPAFPFPFPRPATRALSYTRSSVACPCTLEHIRLCVRTHSQFTGGVKPLRQRCLHRRRASSRGSRAVRTYSAASSAFCPAPTAPTSRPSRANTQPPPLTITRAMRQLHPQRRRRLPSQTPVRQRTMLLRKVSFANPLG